MPEGPGAGRVGAQRRAWTMPSTAPASSARWWCRTIRAAIVVAFCRRTALVREPIPAERVGVPRRSHLAAEVRMRAASFSCTNWARRQRHTRHDQRWRERPRQGAQGSGAGHGSGVVHAIVGALTSASASSGESAQSAASLACTRQGRPHQALASGSRSWLTRGEGESGAGVEMGGQPDAIFAWPPVWPRRHGPWCRRVGDIGGSAARLQWPTGRAFDRRAEWSNVRARGRHHPRVATLGRGPASSAFPASGTRLACGNRRGR